LWPSGDRSTLEECIERKTLRIGGTFVSDTYELTPQGDDTELRFYFEARGGASFSDGGAAHLAACRQRLLRLKGLLEDTGVANTGRQGRKVSDEGTTLFAFKAYTPEGAAGAGAVGAGQRVISLQSDPAAHIRREARNPEANVVILEPGDWDAPTIPSLAQSDIVAAFPSVVDGASAALQRAFGAGPFGRSLIDRGVGAMPHPRGHVLFVFAIPGRYEWVGDADHSP